MPNTGILKSDLKIFAFTSFFTGTFILLFSYIAHLITPGKLIAFSFAGGTMGLVLGLFLCLKQHYIVRIAFFPVLLCSVIAFGMASFVSSFSFHHPILLVACFLFVGLTTILSGHYFEHHQATSKLYGALGLILTFPALYFVAASLLKFQLGNPFLFGVIDTLLQSTNGQENFNSITPLLFGGGLFLAVATNLFCQIERNKTIKLHLIALNFMVLILAALTGLVILVYVALENLV